MSRIKMYDKHEAHPRVLAIRVQRLRKRYGEIIAEADRREALGGGQNMIACMLMRRQAGEVIDEILANTRELEGRGFDLRELVTAF